MLFSSCIPLSYDKISQVLFVGFDFPLEMPILMSGYNHSVFVKTYFHVSFEFPFESELNECPNMWLRAAPCDKGSLALNLQCGGSQGR